MSHYVPDMDHDGKITSKDAGIFHEMMDEDAKRYSSNWHSCKGSRYSFKEFCIRAVIAVICGGFAGKVMDGTLPINFFTIVLSIICFIVALLLILDLAGVDL